MLAETIPGGVESVLGPVSDNLILEIDCHPLMEETHALMRAHLAELPATGRIAVIGVNDDIALGALGAFAIGLMAGIAVVMLLLFWRRKML